MQVRTVSCTAADIFAGSLASGYFYTAGTTDFDMGSIILIDIGTIPPVGTGITGSASCIGRGNGIVFMNQRYGTAAAEPCMRTIAVVGRNSVEMETYATIIAIGVVVRIGVRTCIQFQRAV